MQEEMRSIGYICPACGEAVVEEKSLFALTAGPGSVCCSCGKSQLDWESDGREFRLWVPCGLCGKTHRAQCSAASLLQGSGVGLACVSLGQICCYIGAPLTVAKAVENLRQVAQKIRAAGKEEPSAFLDSIIMQEVLEELKDIAGRPDGITCGCGSKAYKMQLRHASVDLICGHCGARLRIPAATEEDLQQLCCQMKLRIPGK